MKVIVKRHPPDELYHFGVQGQKWGLRRYQNEDGSLTDAGRQHYGYSMSREVNRLKKYAKKEQNKEFKSKKKANVAAKYKRKKQKIQFLTGYRYGSTGLFAHQQGKYEAKADRLAYKSLGFLAALPCRWRAQWQISHDSQAWKAGCSRHCEWNNLSPISPQQAGCSCSNRRR